MPPSNLFRKLWIIFIIPLQHVFLFVDIPNRYLHLNKRVGFSNSIYYEHRQSADPTYFLAYENRFEHGGCLVGELGQKMRTLAAKRPRDKILIWLMCIWMNALCWNRKESLLFWDKPHLQYLASNIFFLKLA